MENPYFVLRLLPPCDSKDVQRAYRRMLRKVHPDCGGSAKEFERVQKAFNELQSEEGRSSWARCNRTRDIVVEVDVCLEDESDVSVGWTRKRYDGSVEEVTQKCFAGDILEFEADRSEGRIPGDVIVETRPYSREGEAFFGEIADGRFVYSSSKFVVFVKSKSVPGSIIKEKKNVQYVSDTNEGLLASFLK